MEPARLSICILIVTPSVVVMRDGGPDLGTHMDIPKIPRMPAGLGTTSHRRNRHRKPALHRHPCDQEMPLRARIKEFLTSKNRRRRTSRETSRSKSGTASPRAIDDGATLAHPEEVVESQPADSIAVEKPVVEDEMVDNPGGSQKDAPPLQDKHDGGDREDSKTLMVIDAAMEIALILREASDASSVLIPLKASSGVILRILQVVRVSGCLSNEHSAPAPIMF